MGGTAQGQDDDVRTQVGWLARGRRRDAIGGTMRTGTMWLAAATLLGGCDDGQSRRSMGADDPAATTEAADDDGSAPAEGGDGDDDDGGSDGAPAPGEAEPLEPEQIRFYLTRIAPTLVARSLDYDENVLIDTFGPDALEAILAGWTKEPGFGEAMRYMVSDQLAASGVKDGVDFELPGNLAAEIATEDLPWSTLLTADYCVDADGTHIACDTGAPYESGVLATRAYLIPNKGRFNLGRAKRMLETFACRVYPMEAEIQIPLEKPTLIPMFRAQLPEEQTVDEAQGGFGNGSACYGCHSQFGAHAQLFVRFDENGLWQATATGLQDESPNAQLGRSTNGLYTSHMNDPAAAASEVSQMFGEPVENLRDAAEVMSGSPLFHACTVKNLIGRAFDVPSGASRDIDDELIEDLAMRATANVSDPTIRAYVMEVFTDRRVIDAALANMQEAP